MDRDQDRIAIALNYRADGDTQAGGQVPSVTAKGRGLIADQILALAKQNDIPVRQDPDLAAILNQLDVGSPIPVAAFAAVAGILAALYRANADLLEPAQYD